MTFLSKSVLNQMLVILFKVRISQGENICRNELVNISKLNNSTILLLKIIRLLCLKDH